MLVHKRILLQHAIHDVVSFEGNLFNPSVSQTRKSSTLSRYTRLTLGRIKSLSCGVVALLHLLLQVSNHQSMRFKNQPLSSSNNSGIHHTSPKKLTHLIVGGLSSRLYRCKGKASEASDSRPRQSCYVISRQADFCSTRLKCSSALCKRSHGQVLRKFGYQMMKR